MKDKKISIQERQDQIFRNMSADKKMELVAQFWIAAKDMAGNHISNHISYEPYNRSKETPRKDS